MSEPSVLRLVCAAGVVPVVVAAEVAHVRGLAAALRRGGLPVAEVTFRTEASVLALRALAADGDLLVGAGTVIRPQQVDDARAAGARFVVTPGFSAGVIERCRELGMPVIPGVSTATEVIAALDHGCEHRAQVRHVLTILGYDPPDIDGWTYDEEELGPVPG